MTSVVDAVGHNCGLVITTKIHTGSLLAIDAMLRFFANCFLFIYKVFLFVELNETKYKLKLKLLSTFAHILKFTQTLLFSCFSFCARIYSIFSFLYWHLIHEMETLDDCTKS